MVYQFQVTGDELKPVEQAKELYTGNVNTYECVFSFSSAWDEMTQRIAVFNQTLVLLQDDRCSIPVEELETTGRLDIGVFGTNLQEDNLKRISTNLISLNVATGAYRRGTAPQKPLQNVWEQIITLLEKKQDTLTIDTELLEGSEHPITSGAVKEAVVSLEEQDSELEAQLVALGDAIGSKEDKEAGKGLSANDYTDADKQKLLQLPDSETLSESLSHKADKTAPSAAGNIALLDAEGNLADSGMRPADVEADIFDELMDDVQEAVQDSTAHIENKQNPHQVTKEQIGLGNVENTADRDKPISDAAQAALDLKTDKTVPKTPGSIALLDQNGNLMDSREQISDLTDSAISLFSSVPQKSAELPLMDGKADAGISPDYASGDHVHPVDITRAAAYNIFVERVPDTEETDYSSVVTDFTTVITDEEAAARQTLYFENGACKFDTSLEGLSFLLRDNPDASYTEGDLFYVHNASPYSIGIGWSFLNAQAGGLISVIGTSVAPNKWLCFEYRDSAWDRKGFFQLALCDRHNSDWPNAHKIRFPKLTSDKTIGSAAFANVTDFVYNTVFWGHTANSDNPHSVTKQQIGLGSVNNTADKDKPVSDAVQSALDAKLDKVPSAGSGNIAVFTEDGNVADSGKVIGNGVLKIKQNGILLASFGANASGNTTVNVEVPTHSWSVLANESISETKEITVPDITQFHELAFIYAYAGKQVFDSHLIMTEVFRQQDCFVRLKDTENNQSGKVRYVSDTKIRIENSHNAWNIKVYGR